MAAKTFPEAGFKFKNRLVTQATWPRISFREDELRNSNSSFVFDSALNSPISAKKLIVGLKPIHKSQLMFDYDGQIGLFQANKISCHKSVICHNYVNRILGATGIYNPVGESQA